jgi:ribosomal protein L11
MPPKVDPNEVRFIKIKVFGGEPGPAATLAPKLGPLGLVILLIIVERQESWIRHR